MPRLHRLALLVTVGACSAASSTVPDVGPCPVGEVVPNPIDVCACGESLCLSGYFCGYYLGSLTCSQNQRDAGPQCAADSIATTTCVCGDRTICAAGAYCGLVDGGLGCSLPDAGAADAAPG